MPAAGEVKVSKKKSKKPVVIASGKLTTTKAGTTRVTLRLTSAAQKVFKKLAGRKPRTKSARAKLVVTLSKDGLTRKVTKKVTFKR